MSFVDFVEKKYLHGSQTIEIREGKEMHQRETREQIYALAEFTVEDKTSHAICRDLTLNGCNMRLDFLLNAKSSIILKIYLAGKDKAIIICDPIRGHVQWSRQNKKDPRLCFSGIEFTTTVNENHGIPQLLHPEEHGISWNQIPNQAYKNDPYWIISDLDGNEVSAAEV